MKRSHSDTFARSRSASPLYTTDNLNQNHASYNHPGQINLTNQNLSANLKNFLPT